MRKNVKREKCKAKYDRNCSPHTPQHHGKAPNSPHNSNPEDTL